MTNFHTRKTYEEPGLVTAVGSHETDDLGLHFVLDGTSLIIQASVTTSTSGDRGIEESENLAERIVAAVQSWVDDEMSLYPQPDQKVCDHCREAVRCDADSGRWIHSESDQVFCEDTYAEVNGSEECSDGAPDSGVTIAPGQAVFGDVLGVEDE